jgi:arylsulfatase A-like enzyme
VRLKNIDPSRDRFDAVADRGMGSQPCQTIEAPHQLELRQQSAMSEKSARRKRTSSLPAADPRMGGSPFGARQTYSAPVIKHRIALVTTLLLAPLATLDAASVSSAVRQPNVLLVICDDLNDYVETLGGHPQVRTPYMTRLMESGVSFRQAHCTIPICAPSRASFITGLYPHTSRYYGFENWDENEVLRNSRTLMDHFRKNGYEALGTGKVMHNRDAKEWSDFGNPADYSPFANDGEKNIAHPDTPAPYRDDFGPVDGSFGPLMNLTGRVSSATGKPLRWMYGDWRNIREMKYESENDRDPTPDERNAQWAVEKLKTLAASPDRKPFFMGVGFIRPHTPLIVPPKYFERFPLDTIQLPVIEDSDAADTFLNALTSKEDDRDGARGTKMFKSLVASHGGSRDLALKKFIQAYLASIASVDDLIGDILDVVDHSRLKDNTIIILTSDNGWAMGQKDWLYKNSLWQESTHIPLVVRAPGVSKTGGSCNRPVSLIDLYPTLLDLCGLPTNTIKNAKGRPLDGHSLKPLLLDPVSGKWDGPDAVLTALYKWAKHYDPAEQSYTLRDRNWRYIRYQNGKEELYHVAEDRYEWTNLALNPEYSAQLAACRAELLARIPDWIQRRPRKDLHNDWLQKTTTATDRADELPLIGNRHAVKSQSMELTGK